MVCVCTYMHTVLSTVWILRSGEMPGTCQGTALVQARRKNRSSTAVTHTDGIMLFPLSCFLGFWGVENYRKSRPTTYFSWLLPVCPWHVFLPAEAAGFPETGWSCWSLRLSHFCGHWSSKRVLYSCQALPFVFCCSVCYYNSLPDCTNPAGSAWIAAGWKGLLLHSYKHSSKVERSVLLPQGHRKAAAWLIHWEEERKAMQVACSLINLCFTFCLLKQSYQRNWGEKNPQFLGMSSE